MAEPLQQWLAQLSERPLPVWRASRDALLRLARHSNYNSGMLTRALAHDPLLCAQLLRLANSGRAGGSIATLEQAAVMLGAEAMYNFAASLPVLEDRLSVADQAPLRQLQRRSFHVAMLARELTRLLRELRYDDAFYAGLLYDLAEMAMRAHSPRVLPQIRRLAAQRGMSRRETALEVLGFDADDLRLQLSERWRLPFLLRDALDAGRPPDRRSEAVTLAAAVLDSGPEALTDLADPRLARLSELLGEPPEAVRRAIFRSACEAAAWLCERVPPRDESFVELFPGLPEDGCEDEPPAPAVERPQLMERFEQLLRAPSQPRTLEQVLEGYTEALRDGLGFDRVMFALLTPDRRTLRGRYFRGVATDAPLRRFEFDNDGSNLLLRLLERPAAVWLRPDNAARFEALLTEDLRRLLEVDEFVAQSIFIDDKPIGVCYADRHASRRPLEEREYARFRHHCGVLARHLARPRR